MFTRIANNCESCNADEKLAHVMQCYPGVLSVPGDDLLCTRLRSQNHHLAGAMLTTFGNLSISFPPNPRLFLCSILLLSCESFMHGQLLVWLAMALVHDPFSAQQASVPDLRELKFICDLLLHVVVRLTWGQQRMQWQIITSKSREEVEGGGGHKMYSGNPGPVA